jgi:GDSL-like Lipase/Acylhydrolase family
MKTPLLGSPIEIAGALETIVDASGGVSFSRLPAWTESQYAKGDIGRWAKMPSGVRLRFATSATSIELRVHVYRLTIKDLAEEAGPAGFDLLVNGEEHSTGQVVKGGVVRLSMDGPAVTKEEYIKGESETISFTGLGSERKEIEIWLPSSGVVEIESITTDEEIIAPAKDLKKKWVHYGSSISHCIEAQRPMNIWNVHASRLLNLSIRNLGLAGECHVDGFIARTIANVEADFISLKMGINVVNADSMRERSFVPAVHNFLDVIREKKPSTPIMVISPICCPFHEENPGPTLIGSTGLYSEPRSHDLSHGALNLPRIRTLLETIVGKRNDENLYFLNGLELFGPADAHMMPDLLHPNADGYRLMGERFAASQGALLKKIIK